MRKAARDLFTRWSWLVYPAGCGGVLGWTAGKCPRDPTSLGIISAQNSILLIDALSAVAALAGALSVLAFLLGVAGGERGVLARLADGLGCALSTGLFVLVFLGGCAALCAGLALLSVWAAKGAGPLLGAFLGATSAAAALGIGAGGVAYLGRPLGRYLVKKQREALAGIEEEVQ